MTAHRRTSWELRPNPFWLLPAGAVLGSTLFILTRDSNPLMQQAFIGAMWGAFGAVPLVIVAAFILMGLHNRRARALWNACGFDWYRSRYPEHAPVDGAVGCWRCGATRLHPCNIAGHADVRACACGQCGEVLFYM